ncbi:hypothetical protein BV394_05455 [Brevirhabdus pacifica]|uniref:Uncharacterized protein n=1 Tax=Brevirhabdus pacifica TaxID=1267768 RepID=A0A1U7DGZ0_9RHOB|nr:DUF1150 family protein [Brevirhabdus pacifica]APX89231.1 hypothetical protein BV394_05455 [Brevirhabdus pacifica]OWU76724.1 hypothetical protein ATO5_10830 [Loktanella sp. 22II-4b]PJJ86164.1 hypothetical protein CLV77_0699 [Brevirhabdus pacifica]
MFEQFNLEAAANGKPIVYVRAVDVDDLPEEVRAEAEGLEQLYALHSETGERLALVRDRAMAFLLARQNDFSPVNVH